MKSYFKNFDTRTTKGWETLAIESLKEDGVIVLRGLVNKSQIQSINRKASLILSKPSFLGGEGYYQKDPYKKTYDGFLMGKDVVESVLNEKSLSVIESYLNDDIIINEVLLKNDLGFNVSYFPYHKHTGTDVFGDINKPFGCAAMIYLHDTDVGAFCYSIGSHKLNISKRGEPALISQSIKKEVLLDNLHKIIGKAGDYIIFDERGYHGPEQPVKIPRTVILFGFQAITYTDNKSRTAIPVIISDLINLTKRQLKVAGLGGGTRASYSDYHLRKPTTYKPFKAVGAIIQIIVFLSRIKVKIKSILSK